MICCDFNAGSTMKQLPEETPDHETLTRWPQTRKATTISYDPRVPWPKISIVTPSYNQGEFIEETILSVINQGYPNLEYIIIDGGSIDNTREVIQQYDQFISYWISEADDGQSHAIEKGLQQCSGDIFNWLNSDDYLEEGALKKIALHFLKKNIDVLCTASYLVSAGKKIAVHPQTYRGKNLLVNIGWATRLNQQGMYYRLNVIRNMGGINRTLHYCMDLEMWLRYLLRYGNERVHFSSEILTCFRVHEDSKTQKFDKAGDNYSLFRNEYNSIYYKLAEKSCASPIVNLIADFSHREIYEFTLQLPADIVSSGFTREAIYYYLYAQLSYYLHKDQYGMVRKILEVLFKTRPLSIMNYKLTFAVLRYRVKKIFRW